MHGALPLVVLIARRLFAFVRFRFLALEDVINPGDDAAEPLPR